MDFDENNQEENEVNESEVVEEQIKENELFDYDKFKEYDHISNEEDLKTSSVKLIKNMKLGMDLTLISMPAQFFQPKSTLQMYVQNYLKNGYLLAQASVEEDEILRAVYIVQYQMGCFTMENAGKKPFNPILGEVSQAKIQTQYDSEIVYTVEQVSHHPPISSGVMRDEKLGITFTHCDSVKATFWGKHAKIALMLKSSLKFDKFDESYDYEENDFALIIRILRGMTPEYNGKLNLHNKKTGVSIHLHFRSKPLFRGRWNRVEGKITKNQKEYFTIEGHWDDTIEFIPAKGTKYSKVVYDVAKLNPPSPISYVDLSHERESNKVWGPIINALKEKNNNKANELKKKVEDKQRAEAHHMKQTGKKHVHHYFNPHHERKEFWIPKPELLK